MTYRRPIFGQLLKRAQEPRRFIQVLAGPRQVGKTTLARQVVEGAQLVAHFASADDPALRDRAWLEAQWEIGRLRTREAGRVGALLVVDEAQKIVGWSETVKRLWDEDTASRIPLRVMLLGSAPLLVQRGLAESLAGRFEIVRVGHWTLTEMRDAFGWTLDQYLHFGGYPGAAGLIKDEERWQRYILDSLVETTLSRDILLLQRVDKPALLRQLFRLACEHTAEILAYQKMLGQLQDAGNTTTLAHYLQLLGGAGMVLGLPKYSGSRVRQRGSSPKLVVLNNALVTATRGLRWEETRQDTALRGRLIETAVGAHLAGLGGSAGEVYYWRERDREVDYVVRTGRRLFAIEVVGGERKGTLPGLEAFTRTFGKAGKLLIGAGGLPLEEFLTSDPRGWLA